MASERVGLRNEETHEGQAPAFVALVLMVARILFWLSRGGLAESPFPIGI